MHTERRPFPPFFAGLLGWRFMRGYGGLGGTVLLLLAERPMNGAEIMDAIERMTWGAWRPSPGSVYPTLSRLAEQGLVAKGADGRYSLTEKGKAEVQELKEFRRGWLGALWGRPSSAPEMLTEMEAYTSYFEDVPDKVRAHLERLRQLRDRLDALVRRLEAGHGGDN